LRMPLKECVRDMVLGVAPVDPHVPIVLESGISQHSAEKIPRRLLSEINLHKDSFFAFCCRHMPVIYHTKSIVRNKT